MVVGQAQARQMRVNQQKKGRRPVREKSEGVGTRERQQRHSYSSQGVLPERTEDPKRQEGLGRRLVALKVERPK